MCGIAGLVGISPVSRIAVEEMGHLLDHRGPDDYGVWTAPDHHVVLGHRRLAVLDPTPAGHQPMVRGNQVLTFNGEVYNYLEVAAELAAAGVELESRGDTEVLLAAYRQWGPACLARLNGMFAFAIFDGDERRLFCARDRYGEKPFLFAAGNGFFAFASEYKALFSLREVPLDCDETRLLRFLYHPSRGLDDDVDTLFYGVHQLLPGHQLILDLDDLSYRTVPYWRCQPDEALKDQAEPDIQAQFRELLTDSVRIRMRSDVALGSCLSGGLDSSAIVGIARQLLGDGVPYHVYTGRFPGTEADEWPWAKQVIDGTESISHTVEPTAAAFSKDLRDFVWYNELPVGSSSQYAQWCVFRLAQDSGTTVLLDGQGGDELLGGYEQYFEPYLEALDQSGEHARRQSEIPLIQSRYPLALRTRRQRAGQRLPNRIRHLLAGLTGQGSDFSFGLTPEASRRIMSTVVPDPSPGGFHALTQALHAETFQTSLPVLLRYGDRNSMAHSREVRLPFCDHRLAELVFSLPAPHLMGGAETKRLLRQSLSETVPETIRLRWNKQGFLPPQADWFRDDLLAATEDIIAGGAFQSAGIWRPNWWRHVVRRFRGGESHLATMLWRPFYADAWQRNFVDRVRAMPKHSVFADAR